MTTTPTTADELRPYEEVLDDLIPLARDLLATSREIDDRLPRFGADPTVTRWAELRAVEQIGQRVADRLDAAPTLLALALLRLAKEEATR